MPFSQTLETEGFQKESILKMNSIVMELSYFFYRCFSFENQIMGRL
jgi:hypothetical protein